MPASNRAAYDAIAARWDEARCAFHGRERAHLDAFLDGLDIPSRILDLGCGTGRPIAAELLARGHRVTGVDQSAALLGIARARLPAGEWIEARLEDALPPGPFAGVVCWDALFHVERAAHAAVFARIAAALRPGGRLMLTVGGSEHPAFTDTMFGETFFYDSHPPAKVLELLAQCGFEPVVAEYLNLPTAGRDKGRFAVVARRGYFSGNL